MRRPLIDATAELFEVPQATSTLPAALNFGCEVAHLVSAALKICPLDRYQVAAEMTRLTGKDVNKLTIDGWSSESRDNFNIPFYMVPAFECASLPT